MRAPTPTGLAARLSQEVRIMATHLLNTGEAFLSAADKGFVRAGTGRRPIELDPGRFEALRPSPIMAGVLVGAAITGLTLVAFAI